MVKALQNEGFLVEKRVDLSADIHWRQIKFIEVIWKIWSSGSTRELIVKIDLKNAIDDYIIFSISMLHTKSTNAISKATNKYMKSCKSVKTTFVPPTHPLYIIATSFSAPHIINLKEEL